jgi:cytochrome c-type biogenesis protein CcmH/NrfG
MHHSKLLSLKLHNVSNVWFQTIREKRQQGVRRAQIEKENQENERLESEKARQVVETAMAHTDVEALHEKQMTRPMVRDSVTMPQQNKRKEKNQLEDALIKRIAINPRDIEAYERLGDYYLENNNFQDSLECFKQVLRLSPVHHKARLRIRRLERMK